MHGKVQGLAPEVIREQLRRIVDSPGFVRSERLRRFLTHCVESVLSGRTEDLKEYTIALVAFDRPKHYNPAEDPIVRVEARRLRKKLEEYYETQGKSDPIIIHIAKGGYHPAFEVRKPLRTHPRARVVAAVAIAALICCAIALGMFFDHRKSVAEYILTRITSGPGLNSDPAISADGSLLAFASDRAGSGGLDIWIQPARAGAAHTEIRQLTHDPADDSQPAIAPDNSAIAFRSERQPPGIYLASVQGGTARLLVQDGRNPKFSPDGRWIAYWTGSPGGGSLPRAGKAFVIPSGGGDAGPLLSGFAAAACPAWSDRSSRLLVEASENAGNPLDVWSTGLDNARPVRSGIAALLDRAQLKFVNRECSFAWSADQVVISAIQRDTQNLWRVPVSPEGEAKGALAHLTFGSAGEAVPSAGSSGTIAFASRSEMLGIWQVPITRPDELVRLTEGETTFPQVDDHRLVYLAKAGGRNDVWLKDLATGKDVQMTRSPGDPRYPQLCPGRDEIIYNEGPNAFSVSARQAAVPKLVCNGCARVWQCIGSQLLYSRPVPGGRVSLEVFDLVSGSKTAMLQSSEFDLADPQKSADGWIAFHAIQGPNRRQIFVADTNVRSYPIPQEKWIAVTDGTQLDRNAVWNGSADALYFLSERCGFRCIWKQGLDPATKRAVGGPEAVRHFHSARQGLSSIGDVGAIGLTYRSGYLYFTMSETAGDIWIARSGK